MIATPAVFQSFETREEWLAARRVDARVSASDVSRILGLAPPSWGAGFSVWLDHQPDDVRGVTPGDEEQEDEGSILTEGQEWEPAVLSVWASRRGATVRNLTNTLAVCTVPGLEWAVASLDASVATHPDPAWAGRILECKTSRKGPNEFGPDGSEIREWVDDAGDILPVYYATQGYWQMLVTGAPCVVFVVAIARSWGMPELRTITLHRNADMIEAIAEDVREWREKYLLGDEVPPLDTTSEARAYLTRTTPPPDTVVLSATEAQEVLLEKLAEAATWKEYADEIRAQLAVGIGPHKGIRGAAGTFMRSRSNGKTSISMKRLEALAPELVRTLTERGVVATSGPSDSFKFTRA